MNKCYEEDIKLSNMNISTDVLLYKTDVKKTRNRNKLVVTDKWILSKKNLNELEIKSKENENPPKEFKKLIYNLPEYINYFKKTKAGNNGKNWKKNNEYICCSLHYAYNIYQALGKIKWCKSGKKNTEYGSSIKEKNRCVIITKKGTQCKRSKITDCNMCTQHFKLFK